MKRVLPVLFALLFTFLAVAIAIAAQRTTFVKDALERGGLLSPEDVETPETGEATEPPPVSDEEVVR